MNQQNIDLDRLFGIPLPSENQHLSSRDYASLPPFSSVHERSHGMEFSHAPSSNVYNFHQVPYSNPQPSENLIGGHFSNVSKIGNSIIHGEGIGATGSYSFRNEGSSAGFHSEGAKFARELNENARPLPLSNGYSVPLYTPGYIGVEAPAISNPQPSPPRTSITSPTQDSILGNHFSATSQGASHTLLHNQNLLPTVSAYPLSSHRILWDPPTVPYDSIPGADKASRTQINPFVKTQEEIDREHLNKIIQLRKDLEREKEIEERKKLEAETWACIACTYRNKLDSEKCEMCTTRRIKESLPDSHTALKISGQIYPEGNPLGSSTNNWVCEYCAFPNTETYTECKVCFIPRHKKTSDSNSAPFPKNNATSMTIRSDMWGCSLCTLHNSLKNSVCSGCGVGKCPSLPNSASSSEWTCIRCTFKNKKEAKFCQMCLARPDNEILPDNHDNGTPREGSSNDDRIMWQSDDVVQACNRCQEKFGFLKRRHHCRACGYVFCGICCSHYLKLRRDRPEEKVCVQCYVEGFGKK